MNTPQHALNVRAARQETRRKLVATLLCLTLGWLVATLAVTAAATDWRAVFDTAHPECPTESC